MKTFKVKDGCHAFTALELAIVIFMIALTVLLLFPAMRRQPRPHSRINCTNNLKQTGLAFRMWSDDNGMYPMLFRTNDFDGPNYALQQKMYVYYQAMSNELNTPRIVVCPADSDRTPGTNFSSDFNNSRVSYFVGLDADELYPNRFLAGDRYITNGIPVQSGIMNLRTNQPVGWTKKWHDSLGNVGLADGSVQGFTSSGLQKALENTGTNLTRLALP